MSIHYFDMPVHGGSRLTQSLTLLGYIQDHSTNGLAADMQVN
jgi:hypothetical protein